jgi:eukaryotic-like serine/threonine-protein kinase
VVWDERDREADHPQRLTSSKLPRITADSLTGTGDHPTSGRLTGTSPVLRADGTMFLPPGTLFNEKYAIMDVLGEGDITVVHRARHTVMKNIVVIKLLKGTYASNSKAVLRFQREGQAVSRLSPQNIARVFECGISREGLPFLAQEYLDGKALSVLLKEHGPPPLSMALNIFSQITDALASAHGAGFVHRGLKPSNIFVLNLGTPQPLVKVIDFGIADVFDEDEDGQKKVTQGGKFFGNPFYMSPEQCQGKNLDDRTDIYSLGCVMYESLTGVPPLDGGDADSTLKKQVQEMPRPFRQVVPQRTELALIEPVVFKCLAKDPGSRYQTMAQLSRALKEVEEGGRPSTAS